MSVEQTVKACIEAINTHDIDAISALLPDDHLFIDTYDTHQHGKKAMLKGWIGYFNWFPDYLIKIEDFFVSDNKVAILGFASASFKGQRHSKNESYWHLPAAWKAVVEDKKIKLWKVICDSKIPYEVMEKQKK